MKMAQCRLRGDKWCNDQREWVLRFRSMLLEQKRFLKRAVQQKEIQVFSRLKILRFTKANHFFFKSIKTNKGLLQKQCLFLR